MVWSARIRSSGEECPEQTQIRRERVTDDRRARPDFDQLRALARVDPVAFEAKRREVIEAAIASAPTHRQRRLRGLQWRIETMRDHSPTPMAACVALTDMMWEALLARGGLLDTLDNAAVRVRQPQGGSGAAIVPFPARKPVPRGERR